MRTYEDQLQMRSFFQEHDLISVSARSTAPGWCLECFFSTHVGRHLCKSLESVVLVMCIAIVGQKLQCSFRCRHLSLEETSSRPPLMPELLGLCIPCILNCLLSLPYL